VSTCDVRTPLPPIWTPSLREEGQPPEARRSMMPARSAACGFVHRSVILPGAVVIACSPETAAGACVSGGGGVEVEVVVVVVCVVVVGCVVVDVGGGGVPPLVGGGGGGVDASAAPAPAHTNATATHAAASPRSPSPDLAIRTSTASFKAGDVKLFQRTAG
jgi:hypothetical protein